MIKTQTALNSANIRTISSRSLLSDAQQAELVDIRERLTLDYFRAGDIANDAIVANAQREGVTQQMVLDEVGVWLGKSGRTVRYYAETAAFFSPKTREEYDMLPFSHFDLARNYGDKWRVVLELCMQNPGMSRERLEYFASAYFDVPESGIDVRPPAYEETPPELALDEIENLMASAKEKESSSGPGRSSATIVSRLMNALADLRRLIGEYDLSDEVKEQLVEHGGALMLLIPRIISEIDEKRKAG